MHITLDQALAFVTVVEAGGYGPAAEKLRKSHSSLIYLIQNFERQCDVKLFDRNSYRSSLTGTGRLVYTKCIELLAKAEEVKEACGQIQKGWEPQLKIVYDGILPIQPFLKLSQSLKKEKISTVVQTYTDYLEGVFETFENLKADLMISIDPPQRREFKVIELPAFRSLLVAHRDHPLHQERKNWTTEELRQFDFLTVRSSARKLGLQTQEFEDSTSFFLSDFHSKKEALLQKMGFGWMPEHLILTELKRKTLRPVKWERSFEKQIRPSLLYRRADSLGPTAELVLHHLQTSGSQKARD